MSLSIKKGDYVVVITGEDKGKGGTVLSTHSAENKVVVEGIGIVNKHKKAKNAQDVGGIVKQPSKINISNVALVCSNSECSFNGRPVRFNVKVEEKAGKTAKIRVCSKCGASLEVKKTAKKAAVKKTAAKKKVVKSEAPENAEAAE